MPAKIGAGRKEVFLKALAATGNATLAAERAGLSRSWAGKLRLVDGAFDAACRAALGQAQEGLGGAEGNRPPHGWVRLDGTELVVCRAGRRRAQIVRAGARRWTPAVERRFLDALRATCNLGLACAEAGMSEASLLTHRRRWPDFERRLKAELAAGGAELEAADKARRERPVEPVDPALWADLPWPEGFSIDEAIRVARRHKHERRG